MATIDDPLIEVVGYDTQHSTTDSKQIQPNTVQKEAFNEKTSLLNNEPDKLHNCFVHLKSKFQRRSCLKSKPVILILIWIFLASVLHWIFTDPSSVITPLTLQYFGGNNYFIIVIGSAYVYFAILQLFYPLAGYFADIRYGRYKCVIGSLWSFIAGSLLVGICGLVVCSFILLPYDIHKWSYVLMSVIIIFLGPPIIIGIFIFFSSIVAFNANVIQFGLDQLHDSPTEHLILYIHWYVVLSYVGTELIKIPTSTFTSICSLTMLDKTEYDITWFFILVGILCSFVVVMYLFLLISLFVAFCKYHIWFLSDSGSRNPYKLVYKVISFAREHRNPIRRSAFTYCEDELPSRLDLGKEKYGGPFTTEQVEDVKAFLGIFKVLLALGPLFAAERSVSFLLPLFSKHLFRIFYPCSFSNEAFPSFIIIPVLVFYIVLLRPFVRDYIPGMLKRIGLGMILMVTPILCFFILDTIVHTAAVSNNIEACFLTGASFSFIEESLRNNSSIGESPIINSAVLLIPIFASITGSMIFYIAIYEFIYAQSPHSMKGLMIGTFFAIRGTFQLLGALVFIFPFLAWKSTSSFPSCGFVYYLVNMVVALFGMIVYIWIARKYQNRQRDEPDNIYRYAEEYYEKAQDEPNYDYDDYDNLNVRTNN